MGSANKDKLKFSDKQKNLKERRKEMENIAIRDLEMERQLDEKAMAKVSGGCPGGGMGGGVQTIVWPYVIMANPYDDSTLYGRMPRIPSWLLGMLTPA
jgi:hypothetical protein